MSWSGCWWLVLLMRSPHLGIVGIGRTFVRHLDQRRAYQATRLSLPYWFSGGARSGSIESADEYADVVTVRIVEGQRRAAVRCRSRGDLRPSSGSSSIVPRVMRNAGFITGQMTRERSADRLLAHAAMADMDVAWLLVERVAHRAALAAAGQDDRAHGQSSVSWSGCWWLVALIFGTSSGSSSSVVVSPGSVASAAKYGSLLSLPTWTSGATSSG